MVLLNSTVRPANMCVQAGATTRAEDITYYGDVHCAGRSFRDVGDIVIQLER